MILSNNVQACTVYVFGGACWGRRAERLRKRFETAAMMFGAWNAGSSGCSSFEVRTVVNIHPPSMHNCW